MSLIESTLAVFLTPCVIAYISSPTAPCRMVHSGWMVSLYSRALCLISYQCRIAPRNLLTSSQQWQSRCATRTHIRCSCSSDIHQPLQLCYASNMPHCPAFNNCSLRHLLPIARVLFRCLESGPISGQLHLPSCDPPHLSSGCFMHLCVYTRRLFLIIAYCHCPCGTRC